MGKRVVLDWPNWEIGINVTDLSQVAFYVMGKRGTGEPYVAIPLDPGDARKLGRALLEQADITEKVNNGDPITDDEEPHPRG